MQKDPNEDKWEEEEKARNPYDLLIRDSLLSLSRFVLKQIGLKDTIRLTHLPQKLVRVDARETDSFFLYEDPDNPEKGKSLIHIEYQTDNDPFMLGRMRDYHSRILNRIDTDKELSDLRGLKLHSVVVYAGKSDSGMESKVRGDQVFKGFELVELKAIPYGDFLKSDDVTLISAAVLGDFGNKDALSVAMEITDSIENKTKGNTFLKEKSLRNLFVFSNLRNLNKIIGKLLEKMIKFDETKDIFYTKGMEKGELKKTYSSAFKMMDKGFKATVIKEVLDIDAKLYAEIEKAYKAELEKEKGNDIGM